MSIVRKKHIVFLSYYFPPMGGGGIQRIIKFLKFWDYNSFRVTVITVKPSFFYAEDSSLLIDIPKQVNIIRTGSLDPFRIIYLIKNKLNTRKTSKKVKRKESGNLLRKIAGLLFIPDSRLLWLPFALWGIYRLQKKVSIDLIFSTMPPFTTGITGLFSKKLFKIKYLLDFRDAWINNPYLPKISSFHKAFQSYLEVLTIRSAAGVIFVNPKLHSFYKHSVSYLTQIPTCTVRNGYDPDDFTVNGDSHLLQKQKYFRVGIMGTVYSRGNAPMSLIAAVANLCKLDSRIKDRLRLVFIGKWVAEFVDKLKVYKIDEIVEWVNYLPHKEALKAASNMDVLALAINNEFKGSENVTPGRIYEYLFLNKPILAMCPVDSDLAQLVETHNAGIAIKYSDFEGIQMIIGDWLNHSDKLKSWFKRKDINQYERKTQTAHLLDFITDVLSDYDH